MGEHVTNTLSERPVVTAHNKALRPFVAECDGSKKCIRREVVVIKEPNEAFGAVLTARHLRVYVVFVFKYTSSRECTAAYRAGLHFGDEIVSINSHYVTDLDEQQMTELMAVSDVLFLEIADNPHTETHLATVEQQDRNFGIQEYSAGEIVRVAPEGPAARAGLVTGRTIVAVNGKSTLGFSDRQVIDAISKAFHLGQTVIVDTMAGDVADILQLALLEALVALRAPATPNELIDNDFSWEPQDLPAARSPISLFNRLKGSDSSFSLSTEVRGESFIDFVQDLLAGFVDENFPRIDRTTASQHLF